MSFPNLSDGREKTAFLNGPTEGGGYVAQPSKGLLIKIIQIKSYLLRKALYGLKQAQGLVPWDSGFELKAFSALDHADALISEKSTSGGNTGGRLGINPMIQTRIEGLPKVIKVRISFVLRNVWDKALKKEASTNLKAETGQSYAVRIQSDCGIENGHMDQ
ncbi:hypothetical protein Tco_0345804 [Tanacetum coccineum]